MRVNNKEVGARLYKVRHMLGLGEAQNRMAEEYLHAGRSQYNKWERGVGRLPVTFALDLVELVPGLTLDYIYRGGYDRLRDFDLAARLRAAPEPPSTPPPRASRGVAPTDAAAAAMLRAPPARRRKRKA